MSFFSEFKTFAMRGSVVDLAVGVVIGGAFGSVVSSLVNDIMMPPLGMMTGGMAFKDQAWTLKEAAGDTPAVQIAYGEFLNAVVTFLLIAFAVFLVIKQMNRLSGMLKSESETPPAAPTEKTCEYCQTTIPIAATRCPHCTSQLV